MKLNRAPLRIALVYILAGLLWITLTDWALASVLPGPMMGWQLAKGSLFVLLSGALIFGLVRHELRKRMEVEAEREDLQSRLAGSQRLEAIGRLTGGIAHDFNNLLTAISGNLHSYLERAATDRPGETLEELREAASAAERAEELTRQLLAFGRRQRLRPHTLDLNTVIAEMGQLLHRLIGDRIEIETRLADELWTVTVDRGPLQQVVMNLAINARDAMPDGGRLSLRTSNVQISPEAAREEFEFPILPGDYVLLQVEDTGIGMDLETQSHIYEPFFTTKEKHVGTGLGMSTVYGVVKQSGGYIALDSTPDVGTRFDLYFPRGKDTARQAERPREAPRNAPAAERGSGTVLVVEDEPAVRSLIVRTLERSGYTVRERPDAFAAFSLLQNPAEAASIDLLVTDAIMPGMTGLELIRKAHELRPDLPTLLISGYSEEEFEGDEPYLPKPFTPGQLLARVQQAAAPARDPRATLPAREPAATAQRLSAPVHGSPPHKQRQTTPVSPLWRNRLGRTIRGRALGVRSSYDSRADPPPVQHPEPEVSMRILVMVAALATALFGTLLAGRDAGVPSDTESLDIALFV